MAGVVLVVDDEDDIVTTLTYNLEREGYEVRVASSGAQALAEARRAPHPDLILLDLMLPDLPGTDVCRTLKGDDALSSIPVIMLTAKGEEVDRVVGFELGADDYVVKPFSVRELLLRVRARLRHVERTAGEDGPELSHREVRLDSSAHRAFVGDAEIKLTALEFRLLELFLRRRGRAQSRDRLLADVWGIEADVTTRTVDTHVKRLREKLGDAGRYIETLRGVGYRFGGGEEDS